jgi:lipopolysaccharide heptosyltransferase II
MRASLRRTMLWALSKLPPPLGGTKPLSSLAEPQRYLLIRPDHIGDVLFITPALRALRRARPDAHIACMVGPWAEEVLRHNPCVDEIISCTFPGFTRIPKANVLQPYLQLYREARLLRGHRFDAALVLRFDHFWGAMLAYRAGIPVRIGYGVPEVKLFLTKSVPYVKNGHEVVQNMKLVSALLDGDAGHAGPLEFRPAAEDIRSALNRLTAKEVDQRYICLHPGAGAPVKLWRPEAFAEVADTLARRYRLHVIITGSSDERDLVQDIAERMETPALVLAGETTLAELAAIMGHCDLVIGVDSGPLHLAVSQGASTVHLFGPVDHRAFGPWGDPSRHLVVLSTRDCIPCNRLDYEQEELHQHPCVRSITVAQVIEAADQLLHPNG